MNPFNKSLLSLLAIQGTSLAQLLESSESALVLSDTLNAPLLLSEAKVSLELQQTGEFAVSEHYTVSNKLQFAEPAGQFLKLNSLRADFVHGAVIDESCSIFREPSPTQPRPAALTLMGFRWSLLQPGNRLQIWPRYDLFPNQTDVLIGFTVKYNELDHFGWVHMRRPVIDSITIFAPVAAALHPVSGEPIRAGLPPELPPVDAVIDPLTDTLQIAWPSSFPGVRLERTDSLDAPVIWTPVETPLSNAISLPLSDDADQLYFRLQYVP
jgi:hypothetical protein